MFHHFHSKNHPRSDGSILKDFMNILKEININKISQPDKFLINKKNLSNLYDSLKCQYDIAFQF